MHLKTFNVKGNRNLKDTNYLTCKNRIGNFAIEVDRSIVRFRTSLGMDATLNVDHFLSVATRIRKLAGYLPSLTTVALPS